MKTIERLRELEKEADTPTQDIGHRMAARLRYIDAMKDALPALLAVVEAQQREIEAWREMHASEGSTEDHSWGQLEKVNKCEETTDAAIRAMEGGAG